MKNNFQHNNDGTTHIFVESKSKHFPGEHTIAIDTEDWDKVKEHRWSIKGGPNDTTPYAVTNVLHPDGLWRISPYDGKRRRKRTLLQIHCMIKNKSQKNLVIDHINHNGLDNRKENLRSVTRAKNDQNRRPLNGTSSSYKGVCWHKRDKKWIAQIKPAGKKMWLGAFTCEHEAALAYNKKAFELWGENALLNKVEKQ